MKVQTDVQTKDLAKSIRARAGLTIDTAVNALLQRAIDDWEQANGRDRSGPDTATIRKSGNSTTIALSGPNLIAAEYGDQRGDGPAPTRALRQRLAYQEDYS